MRVYDYAQSNGFNTLSIWSSQRDNTSGSWEFSRLLARFSSR